MSLPGTFVFLVDLKPANPIIFRMADTSGSESTSMADPLAAGCGFAVMVSFFSLSGGSVPLGGFVEEVGGGLALGLEGLWPTSVSFGGAFDDGPCGGERVRVRAVGLRLGERERVRGRSDREGGGSSVVISLSVMTIAEQLL